MAKSIKVWVARDEKQTSGKRSIGVFCEKPVFKWGRFYLKGGSFITRKANRIVGLDLKPGECRSARIVLEDK